MFKIHINDGTNELPKDDIFYIVAKDGIYLKKTLGVMDSIAPVKNISTLQEISTVARMNIKKIPGGQFAKVIAFFKEVYNKYKSEAVVLLFYNEKTKVYKIVVPQQKVSATSIEYDRGMILKGYNMIGTIHSHAAMSAFHSGTDHDDEISFDGLHITIGNINADFSISASIISNKNRFMVEPEEYINRITKIKDVNENITKPVRVVYKYCHTQKKLVPDEKASARFGTTSYTKLDKRYQVNVSERNFKVSKGWMDMVEHITYYNRHWQNHYHRNQHMINHSWGGHYDASLWGYGYNYNNPNLVGKTTMPATVDDKKDNDDIPCLTCKFKNYKILIEEDEDDTIDYYVCKKCESIWEEENLIDGEQCPICITGDFLIPYEDQDGDQENEKGLKNNYVLEDKYDHLFEKDTSIPLTPPSEFISCPHCNETFHMFNRESKCPFCHKLLTSKVQDTESEREQQLSKDSGQFLGEDTEEINLIAKEIIQKSKEINVEKIPDPNENSTPIQENQNIIRGMFRKVFGRKW